MKRITCVSYKNRTCVAFYMQVVNVSNRFYKTVYLEQNLNQYQLKTVLLWDCRR